MIRLSQKSEGIAAAFSDVARTIAQHCPPQFGGALSIEAAAISHAESGQKLCLMLPQEAVVLHRLVGQRQKSAPDLPTVLAALEEISPWAHGHFEWRAAPCASDGTTTLALVANRTLAGFDAQAKARGAHLTAIALRLPDGTRLSFREDEPLVRRARQALVAAVGATSLAALVASGLLWYDLGEARAATAEAAVQIERLRAAVETAHAIVPAAEELLVRRATASSRVATLANLATFLPQDSWLTGLTIDGDAIEIAGWSPAPDRLLPVLAEASGLRDVVFAAASVLEQKTGRYQFRIAAALGSAQSQELKP